MQDKGEGANKNPIMMAICSRGANYEFCVAVAFVAVFQFFHDSSARGVLSETEGLFHSIPMGRATSVGGSHKC